MSTATPDRDGFGPDELDAVLRPLLAAWPAARLLVGLSGGPDSAALLAVLGALAARHPALRLRALHVDHGLQAASALLAEAARRQALSVGVPFAVAPVHVPAGDHGVEAAARDARYGALAAALAPGEVLLTAHHQDDQAETVLLQLLRGAGVSGAAAMPDCCVLGQGLHVRPCLSFTRAALARAAATAGLASVADPMNADARFERAFLRTRLVPTLTQRWPAWARTLSRAARHFAAAQTVLEEVAAADVAAARDGEGLSVARLRALSVERQALALRYWLRERGFALPNTRRLDAVRAMLEAGPASCPQVRWPGVVVFRHGGCVHAVTPAPAWPAEEIALSVSQAVPVAGLGSVQRRAAAMGEPRLAQGTLTLRRRGGGERLKLRGDGPRRPVKDLLREARVPALMRDCVPFLWRDGEFVGLLTPTGAWLDHDALAPPGEPGLQVLWSEVPAALRAAFIEAPQPLP